MNKLYLAQFRVLFLLGLILGTELGAQEITNPPSTWAEIYVFSSEGLPLQGVSTQVGDKSCTSDESGLLTFEAPSGLLNLQFLYEEKAVAKAALNLKPGHVNELFLRLKSDGELVANQVPDPENQGSGISMEDRPLGTLSGEIVHMETGKPVPGVLVILRGLNQDVRTDTQGVFSAQVPVGVWTLSLIHPEFATQTLAEVEVKLEPSERLSFQLTPTAIQMESMRVVSGTDIKVQGGMESLLEETKNSSVVLSLIGAEQVAKNGDSDAAQALSRVTGLTLVDGKYVYVRGMGDRYSTSTLNGLRLPSPEIDKRVVPLDLFPANVIESLSIQKTFSPDMNGEFGGGVVNIRTRGIPVDRFQRRLRWSLAVNVTYDPELSFTDQLLGHEGKTDWIGLDDGDRQLPAELKNTDKRIQEANFLQVGYTPQDLAALAASLANTWDVKEQMFLPSWGLNLGLRDKYDWEEQKFGFSTALIYRREYDRKDSSKLGPQTPDGKSFTYKYQVNENSKGVDYGALHSMEYQWGNTLSLSSTSLGLRSTDNILEKTQGPYEDQIIEYYDYYWLAQTLLMEALGFQWSPGFLNGGYLKLAYGLSYAQREEPSHLYARFNKDLSKEDGKYFLFQNAGFPLRMYVDVSDTIHDLQGGLSLPLGFIPFGDITMDLGGSFFHQSRDSRGRKIKTIFTVDTTGDQFSWTDDPLTLREFTRPTDNFEGTHTVTGAYGIFDFLLWDQIRTSAGLRYESSLQKVNTYDPFTKVLIPSKLLVTDFLPGVSLTLPLFEKHQVRASYYQTVNRPDLTELSATVKEGAPGEGEIWGNNFLQEAHISNGDFRYEFYLNQKENLSLGGFYKFFTNVIESSSIAGSDPRIQAVNIPQATNWGLEVEWNLSLFTLFSKATGLLATSALNTQEFLQSRLLLGAINSFLLDTSFSGNMTWIQSVVDYSGGDQGVLTSSTRPLQGQSPYVVNLSLGYKNALSWFPDVKSDTGISINYNVFGPRIKKLGSNGFADNYELPFQQLDLVLKHRFNEYLSLDLKAKNLLDPDSLVQMGDVVISKLKKGRSFSLGLKVDF